MLLAGAAGVAAAAGGAPLTAAQIIDRIRTNVGVPWRAETVDRVIAGDAQTPVKGIATTMMSTLDVIQRCAVAGKNFIVTHEPTFWLHQDTVDTLRDNAVYKRKADFIREKNLVIFRFHDHWHAHRPDGIATGMMRELGWEYVAVDRSDPREFIFPKMPLGMLVQMMRNRLHIRAIRVVGDLSTQIRKVTASWGYLSRDPGIQLLARPDVDVVVCGEAREWEVVEYAQDAVSAGQAKALILLGHVVSEQAGMKYCAEWLNGFVTDVPVEFVATDEPFVRVA